MSSSIWTPRRRQMLAILLIGSLVGYVAARAWDRLLGGVEASVPDDGSASEGTPTAP